MNNREQAQMKMLGGVCVCLSDNAEVYADDAPFQIIADKTIADTNAVVLASTKLVRVTLAATARL